MIRITVLRLMAIAAVSLVGGCSNLGQVSPWEKGALAKPEMIFDSDPLNALFSEHIYSSREGASGGSGVGGGGCGCN